MSEAMRKYWEVAMAEMVAFAPKSPIQADQFRREGDQCRNLGQGFQEVPPQQSPADRTGKV